MDDYADIVEDPRHNTILSKSKAQFNDFISNNTAQPNHENLFGHPSIPKLAIEETHPIQVQETDYASICPSSTMALGR